MYTAKEAITVKLHTIRVLNPSTAMWSTDSLPVCGVGIPRPHLRLILVVEIPDTCRLTNSGLNTQNSWRYQMPQVSALQCKGFRSKLRINIYVTTACMHWFSHGHSELRRGPLLNKCRTRTAHQRTTPEQNAAISFFCPRWPWPLTLTFKFRQNFCTMHLTAKFHHSTFNRSEVMMLTNKQTDKQSPLKHPPRSAMLCRCVKKLQ